MSLAASLSLLAAVPAGADPVDPFSNAAPDWIVCFEPRLSDKTCSAISRVEKIGPGRYRDRSNSYVAENQIIIERVDEFTVVDGQTCEKSGNQASYQAATFRRPDRLMDVAEQAAARRKLIEFSKRVVGSNMTTCMTYFESEDRYKVHVEYLGQPTANGRVLFRSFDIEMRWLHEDEGYTLRPH